MTTRPRSAALALVAAAAGCAQPPLTLDQPHAVSAMPLTPYESREECVRLAAGDRLDYRFEASEPVMFEIRYREGFAVIAPVVREPSRGDAGVFVAVLPRDYCLVWEAGVAGALVDYRLRKRTARER
jgi:hypothetical protein